MAVDLSALQTHASLRTLTLLGVTIDGSHFLQRHQGLELDPHPSWHAMTNGNPANMLDVTRSLFEDNHKRVLFILERDTNRNVLMYTYDADALMVPQWLMIPGAPVHYNSDEPLNEDAEIELGNIYTEELTPLESTIGYGVRVDRAEQEAYIHALRDQPIYVRKVGEEWYAMIQLAPDTAPLFLRKISIITQPRPLSPIPRVIETHLEVQQSVSGPLIVYRYRV